MNLGHYVSSISQSCWPDRRSASISRRRRFAGVIDSLPGAGYVPIPKLLPMDALKCQTGKQPAFLIAVRRKKEFGLVDEILGILKNANRHLVDKIGNLVLMNPITEALLDQHLKVLISEMDYPCIMEMFPDVWALHVERELRWVLEDRLVDDRHPNFQQAS
ncbi:K+ transport system [Striga asiatica]|uniref:K+ transport system n=1 Tax=Striga asiatica TaxID=4170 RepID=A0A5A7PB07_STRAF|nr:K+ transport system [Striga asiatica]